MIIVKRAELTNAPEPRNGAWSTPSGWLRGRVMLGVRASTGKENAMINETDIQEFKARLRGELTQRGEPRYEEARKVFNGMIDKRPALIVRCAGVSDVIALPTVPIMNGSRPSRRSMIQRISFA
ncbi:MAG TPA: hypothetical protein VFF31_24870 [Blastocatellia bacterium]|nr:hypothetical protein [Blastocatellia bacterium]